MEGDVTRRETMRLLQGKRVRVVKQDGSREWALTIVRVLDGARQELRLVNRDSKAKKPDWALTQKLWDAIEPAERNDLNCGYEVTIK